MLADGIEEDAKRAAQTWALYGWQPSRCVPAVSRVSLEKKDHHVIVNCLRRAIRQERGGHISLPAAYVADTDRFLILDLSVTNISHLPVWVAAEDLFFTMNTTDPDNKRKIGVRTDP